MLIEANGDRFFSDRHLPRFLSYTGNIVGVALTTEGIVASTWSCSALSAATTPTGKISVTMRICGLTFSMTRTKRAASWWRCGGVLKLTGETSTQLQLLLCPAACVPPAAADRSRL
jgi:hypothetical protein